MNACYVAGVKILDINATKTKKITSEMGRHWAFRVPLHLVQASVIVLSCEANPQIL